MNPQQKRLDLFILIRTADQQRLGTLVKQLSPNPRVAEMLARWRNANREWFFDSRPVTVESTLKWMETVINNPAQSLFIIEDDQHQAIGTYNYTILDDKTVRLDNLIRGEKGGHKALIYGVEVALLGYLFHELKAERVITETLEDNERVNRLLESVGFTLQRRFRTARDQVCIAWENTLPQYQTATHTTDNKWYVRIPEWAK